MDAIDLAHGCVLSPRRVTKDHVESASLHDPIELCEPVKWLVGLVPLLKGVLFLRIHAVLTSKEMVEFIGQLLQPLAKVIFVGGCDNATKFRLLAAEHGKQPVHICRCLLDSGYLVLAEAECAFLCLLHSLQRSEANQRIARADIKVNVR